MENSVELVPELGYGSEWRRLVLGYRSELYGM
jgi:hypothetical protein